MSRSEAVSHHLHLSYHQAMASNKAEKPQASSQPQAPKVQPVKAGGAKSVMKKVVQKPQEPKKVLF